MGATASNLADRVLSASTEDLALDSDLMAECQQSSDPQVCQALCVRHQGLGNKEATSARHIRGVIREIAGEELDCVWEMLSTSQEDPLEVPDHPGSGSQMWAAANVLGQVGGAHTFYRLASSLDDFQENRRFLIVRLIAHSVMRYLSIASQHAPTFVDRDVASGQEQERLIDPYAVDEDERALFTDLVASRTKENELFLLVRPQVLGTLHSFVTDQPAGPIGRVLMASIGIPGADRPVSDFGDAMENSARKQGIPRISWVRELVPQGATLGTAERLAGALRAMGEQDFWRALVVGKRRKWTTHDQSPSFLREDRWEAHGINCEVWMGAPGTAYPYRINVSVPKGHPQPGLDLYP